MIINDAIIPLGHGGIWHERHRVFGRLITNPLIQNNDKIIMNRKNLFKYNLHMVELIEAQLNEAQKTNQIPSVFSS